jgi:RNA polymerase-binding transcription factor DksA
MKNKNDKQTKPKLDAVVCEQCGRKIPKERLKAIPDTVLCVHCAEEFENDGDVDRAAQFIDYDPNELLDVISSDD